MIKNIANNFDVQGTYIPEKPLVKRRVLFIEQNNKNSHKLVEMLAIMPRYPVSTTVVSIDAITEVQANEFDVIMIDVSAPQPPKWDQLHLVCEQFKELPLIAFSNNELQGIEALRIGAKDYLIEAEVNPRVLARTIRYTLEHYAVLQDLKKAKLQEESAKARSAHLLDLSSQLKTPINVILGFTEVMHEGQLGSVGSAKYEDYIADTHKCATHLNSMLDNLLQSNNPGSVQ